VVPLALVDDTQDSTRHSTKVPVYPVIGPAAAPGHSDLSIRFEGDGPAKVVTVNSAASPADSATPPAAILLDTRDLKELASAIALDIGIPAGQPVTLTLLSSANLKDWEPLAEKVLFRPADGSALLGGASVALSGADLHDRYVGISWGGATGVTLKGASVVTSQHATPPRIGIAADGAALTDAHELRFDLPISARFSAIRVTETGPDGVIPVKLFGRDREEEPWALLAAGTLQSGSRGNLLDLSGQPMTSFRLQADSRTAGFSATPKLELMFDPVDLLVALSGTPPYRLAVGQASAPGAYLALSEIAPQGSPARLAELPQVKFAAPNGPPPMVSLQASAVDGAFAPRKLVLWGALLIGTLVLAFAAAVLLRGTVKGATNVD